MGRVPIAQGGGGIRKHSVDSNNMQFTAFVMNFSLVEMTVLCSKSLKVSRCSFETHLYLFFVLFTLNA